MQLTLIPTEYSPPAATYHPVAELPRSERPAERLRQVGAGALSSAELLDLLVGDERTGYRARAAGTLRKSARFVACRRHRADQRAGYRRGESRAH